jgi:PAS domain S-box-containing protein
MPAPPAVPNEALALAFHLAPVGMCVTRDRAIELCNEAFAHMFGHAQAELLGQPLAPLYPSFDEFTHTGHRGLKAMRDTGGYSDERIMRRRGGSLFWCHVAGRALDRADPFARAVWMFEDISHRRPVGTPLTVREREIAQHIVTGATSKQIGRHLDISHRTVDAHRARLMRKLGASSTGELVALLLGAPR